MNTETLALVGVITGVVGAATGLASLAWQVMVHRGQGRVVTVRSCNSIPVYEGPDGPYFRGDDQISIDVVNKGGASVAVLRYGVRMGKRKDAQNLLVPRPHIMSTSLPAVVEPGGEPVSLHVPVAALRRANAELGIPFEHMRPWVVLGDGRTVFSRNAVPLR